MFLAQSPLPQALGSPVQRARVGLRCPSSRPAGSPHRQPGLAAPGAARRRWPCLGGTLGPRRYRGIRASPPCVSGCSMVRPQLRSLGLPRWEQPCSGSAPGARLSKSSGGAVPTGRRGRPWGLRMKRARQICSQSVCRDSSCPAVHPCARAAIDSLCPALPRPPTRPACMLPGRAAAPS